MYFHEFLIVTLLKSLYNLYKNSCFFSDREKLDCIFTLIVFLGTQQGTSIANEKKLKIADQLRMLEFLFRRLRIVYEKCNENCQLQGLEYTHIESLIPIKDEWDAKSDEKKTSESYRLMCEESKEIMEVRWFKPKFHIFFFFIKKLIKLI